jgi:hypothetical protein
MSNTQSNGQGPTQKRVRWSPKSNMGDDSMLSVSVCKCMKPPTVSCPHHGPVPVNPFSLPLSIFLSF